MKATIKTPGDGPAAVTTGTEAGRTPASKPAEPVSVISRDICLEGDLVGKENLVVEGRVKGRIETRGDVVVAAGGHVEAAVLARNITIQGTVNGNVEAREAVEIQPEGVLIGDCRARTIQIREGARFEGRSDYFK